jgi:ectoine hydroxylase-related dioxygenase (phytanoyl-CoA dioxygenase family)
LQRWRRYASVSPQNIITGAGGRKMNKALTDEQVAAWRRKGYLYPFDMLSEAERQECLAGLARFEKWLGARVNATKDLKWRTMPHITLPWFTKLVQDPRILDKIEDLIGPDIMVFTSTFFIKEPHSPTVAAWHQDSTYYGIGDKPEVATAWIALTEASHEAGCMDVLPHESGGPRLFNHAANAVENSVNRAAQVVTEPLDESGMETMSLQPGQFSLHHGLCLHRSGPNNSNHRRIGVGMNFISPREKPLGKFKTCAMLVRGEDRYGHFERVTPPKAELDADSIAQHEMAVTRYRDTYYEQEPLHLKRSA